MWWPSASTASARTPAVLSYPGTGTGKLRAATTFLPANQGGCEQLAAGDLAYVLGDGQPLCQQDDLLALSRGGGGTLLGSRGWSSMRWVDGGYSLNADSYPDVIAMNSAGDLMLYPQTSRGVACSLPPDRHRMGVDALGRLGR